MRGLRRFIGHSALLDSCSRKQNSCSSRWHFCLTQTSVLCPCKCLGLPCVLFTANLRRLLRLVACDGILGLGSPRTSSPAPSITFVPPPHAFPSAVVVLCWPPLFSVRLHEILFALLNSGCWLHCVAGRLVTAERRRPEVAAIRAGEVHGLRRRWSHAQRGGT